VPARVGVDEANAGGQLVPVELGRIAHCGVECAAVDQRGRELETAEHRRVIADAVVAQQSVEEIEHRADRRPEPRRRARWTKAVLEDGTRAAPRWRKAKPPSMSGTLT